MRHKSITPTQGQGALREQGPLIAQSRTCADATQASHQDLQSINEGLRAENQELSSRLDRLAQLATESERLRRVYEAALTNTPDFVYVFGLDHRVVYANDALIAMWGRGLDGAIGKTFLEIGYEPWLAEMHERDIDLVRTTRQPVRGEVAFEGTHGRRQYDYIFVPVMDDHGAVQAVAGTTRDVTQRQESEQQLRASEERHTFLVALADSLRPLTDPVDVQAQASRLLGEWLGANRVSCFAICGDACVIERGYSAGVQPLAGRYPAAVFGQAPLAALLEGRTVVENDASSVPDRTPDELAAFAAIQVRGHVNVPLVKGGRCVNGMSVQVSGRREWAPQEVALIEETAERTWAEVERVRAEAALRVSEAGRRLALDAAELGAFNYDPATHTMTCDERFCTIFAGSTSLLSHQQAFAAVHPDDLERVREAVAAATRLDEPAPYAEEYRVVHPDGAVRWVFARARANVAGDGLARRLVSFDGIVADTTARKEAELRVQESEQRFRLLTDVAPVLIWMSGTDRLCHWFNQPWLDFTGRSMDQEVGDGWAWGVHRDDHDRCLQAYTAAFDARTPFSMEYRLRRHDGEFRWLIDNGAPRFRSGGAFDGYIGSCLDVTEYKNAENDMREADRRKDEFLATLAHELRNPLAPMHSGLQVIRKVGADSAIEQVRSMMERQLQQMTRLVDDLLEVSRLKTGKLELRTERVTLQDVVAAALETSRPVIELHGQVLEAVVPDEPLVVDGDPVRLAQVVSNLLTNSAKYTPRGGHIRVSVVREDATSVLTVADNGIGIPTNMLDAVFGMFCQVDRALERATGGLGIGLSLVKGLVEMHGGSIEAFSEGEGRGSLFAVRLPVAKSAASRSDPAEAGGGVDVAAARLGPTHACRVLIVDDNVDAADSLGQLLGMMGNEVLTAYDGESGVEAARMFKPDVVLCDIGMPKMNGYDTARMFRAQDGDRSTVLVALTGYGQADDRVRSADAGFDHHLVKPVDTEALAALLQGVQSKERSA